MPEISFCFSPTTRERVLEIQRLLRNKHQFKYPNGDLVPEIVDLILDVCKEEIDESLYSVPVFKKKRYNPYMNIK